MKLDDKEWSAYHFFSNPLNIFKALLLYSLGSYLKSLAAAELAGLSGLGTLRTETIALIRSLVERARSFDFRVCSQISPSEKMLG